jgi:hypothetical protein
MLVVPVLVAEKVGVTPATKLLKASLIVIVILAAAVPLATVGPLATIVVVDALGEPARKTNEACTDTDGLTTLIVLISALVDFKEQVESPLASLAEQALIVLPDPVAEKVGTSPARGRPSFFTLMEMVEDATPLAKIFEVPEMVVV